MWVYSYIEFMYKMYISLCMQLIRTVGLGQSGVSVRGHVEEGLGLGCACVVEMTAHPNSRTAIQRTVTQNQS